jgi:hypothetical protein
MAAQSLFESLSITVEVDPKYAVIIELMRQRGRFSAI